MAGWFGCLEIGLVMSIGSLCVSITDAPGPIHHRFNGMLISGILCSLISVITFFSASHIALTAFILLLSGFIFSMLTVYGNRSTAIGIAVLVMQVLSLGAPLKGMEIWWHAFYILFGSLWYLIYSVSLYRMRPYKLIQQLMGEYIIGISQYLRGRAGFYDVKAQPELIYKKLLSKQVEIDQSQHLLSELLFKTRAIIRETTRKGRILLKIYLDVTELYESIMTTYQQYKILHEEFGETGIMSAFRELLILISDNIDHLSLAMKTGERSYPDEKLLLQLKAARSKFESLRITHMKGDKIDHFVSLGRIMANLEDLSARVFQLYELTGFKVKLNKDFDGNDIYQQGDDIRFKLFIDNLNMQSNVFRHSLRVALALLTGFLIAHIFNVGHSYWILLTIVVILKPAYSLTKQRNKDRLIGTAAGILAGLMILLLTNDKNFLLFLLIISMAVSYINMRTNYFISVLSTTVYMIVFFHLIYPVPLKDVLSDRLIDTAIGSGISLLASLFLIPMWQQTTIRMNMIKMLHFHKDLFHIISESFTVQGKIDSVELKQKRKGALIQLANLTDAFNRMMSEPRQFQKDASLIYQFVIISHNIISHLATLSYFLKVNNFRSDKLGPVIQNTISLFDSCAHKLEGNKNENLMLTDTSALNNFVQEIMLQREAEINKGLLETETKKKLVSVKSVTDQFNYIYRSVQSLNKVCAKF